MDVYWPAFWHVIAVPAPYAVLQAGPTTLSAEDGRCSAMNYPASESGGKKEGLLLMYHAHVRPQHEVNSQNASLLALPREMRATTLKPNLSVEAKAGAGSTTLGAGRPVQQGGCCK